MKLLKDIVPTAYMLYYNVHFILETYLCAFIIIFSIMHIGDSLSFGSIVNIDHNIFWQKQARGMNLCVWLDVVLPISEGRAERINRLQQVPA